MSFVPSSFTAIANAGVLRDVDETLLRSWSAPRVFSANEIRPSRAALIWAGLIIALLFAAAVTVGARFPSAPKTNAAMPLQRVTHLHPVTTDMTTYRALAPQALIPDMNFDLARSNNAAVPFTTAHFAPAPPYRFSGSEINRAGATTCLSAAVLFEAGDDKAGQQAVAQVILNRLRHPAFPKTICGVVFQGAERSTGCQFTFTCDGSLARVPNPADWKRANAVAQAALSGFVYGAIGSATHYHTDWVVPYWRDTLEKLVQVHTQIFYRWRGWQVKKMAPRAVADTEELVDPRIALLALPGAKIAASAPIVLPEPMLGKVAAPTMVRPPLEIPGILTSSLKGSDILFADPEHAIYLLRLDPDAFPGSWAVASYAICNGKPNCTVYGWTTAEQVPAQYPMASSDMKLAAFSYQKDGQLAAARWDCRRYPRREASQCIAGTRMQINALTVPGASLLPDQARVDPKTAPDGVTQG